MKLKLIGVQDAGNLARERVVLRAEEDDDLGSYAIFRCEQDKDGEIDAGGIMAFWFQFQSIKAREYIILYTKKGTDSVKKNGETISSRFYYWDLSGPIWTGKFTPILVATTDWDILPVASVTEEPASPPSESPQALAPPVPRGTK